MPWAQKFQSKNATASYLVLNCSPIYILSKCSILTCLLDWMHCHGYEGKDNLIDFAFYVSVSSLNTEANKWMSNKCQFAQHCAEYFCYDDNFFSKIATHIG